MNGRWAIVATLALAACTSSTKPVSTQPQTICDQVRGAPALRPSDWKRLADEDSHKRGVNAEENWQAVKDNVAQNCPELLVRLVGS